MVQEINIAGFISTEATWLTAQQKQDMLDDFCTAHNYQETVDDGQGGQIPNPQSKSSFFNDIVQGFVRDSVKSARVKVAREAIVVEELDL